MPAAPTQVTPAQITATRIMTTQPAAALSGTAHPESAQTVLSQDPLAADGRLREAALERPNAVANPRRVRVR
jgi:hypothetical protein